MILTSLGATTFLGIIIKELFRKVFKTNIGFKLLLQLIVITVLALIYFGMIGKFVVAIIVGSFLSLIVLETIIYKDEFETKYF